MEFVFSPAQYRGIPVLYWPWVFLQLWRLHAWVKATGRRVLYEISANGRVHIRYVSDDPRDLNVWIAHRNHEPQPHVQACHNCDGSLQVHGFVLAVAALFERYGCRAVWRWVRITLRPVPPFKDSS